MGISSWLCKSNAKNMLVKIVHPGGHVELHDRPVLAAEVMQRNPKFCVARPHVFRQPWAIVTPETTLMLGQKFYVVPISTIRKLQRHRHSFKRSPSHLFQETETEAKTNGPCKKDEKEDDDSMVSICSLFVNKITSSPKLPHACFKQQNTQEEMEKDGQSRKENCFPCLFKGMTVEVNSERLIEGTRSSDSAVSSEAREPTGERTHNFSSTGSSTKRRTSFDNWQPNLEGIDEE